MCTQTSGLDLGTVPEGGGAWDGGNRGGDAPSGGLGFHP